MFFKKKIIPLTILFIAIITVWVSSNVNWGKDRWTRIIKVDGNGYYAYLPATFIYHDLHFGFFDEIAEREGYQNMKYDYRIEFQGKIVDKYFAGAALAQLPFFLLAHALSALTGEPMDGYSVYYFTFINIASIFYLLLSCIIIARILKVYSISATNTALVIPGIVFGTNLFYYTVYEPSMSHVYSLAFVALFAYHMLRFLHTLKPKYLVYSALWLGIITLIRPVNILVILGIPFLSGGPVNLKNAFHSLSRHWGHLLLALLLFMVPVFLQLMIYKVQTGSFWVYAYADEHFYFNQPHMVKMLFSYRKGLFVYAPLLFLSLTGLLYIYNRGRFGAISWLAFFLMVTYVLSCWHQWYYGGSFGSRVFIEYYVFFAILLGMLLQHLRGKIPRLTVISLIFILGIYSIIQTYQYYAGIMHWSDMNSELYWDIFLKFKS